MAVVVVGFAAGRMRWLGPATGDDNDPSRVLSNAAFYIFVPALLFRTTARLDVAAMPWHVVGAYFVPTLLMVLGVHGWQRWHRPAHAVDADAQAAAALTVQPSVRAIGASFGNTVQLGIPLAAALFGDTGLGLHVTLVSVHALIILTVVTVLVELDLARGPALGGALRQTLRNTVIHPVMLPVLAGLAWNLLGLPLPAMLDEVLQMLGSAVVPLCLVLIGVSLAYSGLPSSLRPAWVTCALKLVVLPALVLVVARWGFGLRGDVLAVLVVMASLPVGSNALMFAQRYRSLEAESTAAIVFSTLLFVVTLAVWLSVLRWLGG